MNHHKLIDSGLQIFTKAKNKFELAKRIAEEERDILKDNLSFIQDKIDKEQNIMNKADFYIKKLNNFIGE